MKERTKRILRQAGRRMSALVILFAMALTAAANLPTEVWAANGEMTGGWTFNEHYYRIYDKGLDWYAAKEYCENVGGHLNCTGRFVQTEEQLLAFDYSEMNALLSSFLDAMVEEYRREHCATVSQVMEKMIAFSDGNIHDIDQLIEDSSTELKKIF